MQSNTPSGIVSHGAPVFVGGLVLAAVIGGMLHVGGAPLRAPLILGLLFGGAIVVLSGLLLASWTLGETRDSRLALSIVLGSLATSLALVAGYFLTGLRAGIVFVWWSALVMAAAWWTRRRWFVFAQTDRQEILAVLAIALLVAVWCRATASLLPTIDATGVAPVWVDYFVHGAEIAQFGDRLARARSLFALSDQPIGLYHFAPYMLPAAVSSLVDLPALGLSSSVLFPYGILLAALGSYVLARTLGGPVVGLLAPVALLIVPDASTHGMKNGFFSLHWFLGASPGTGPALGVAFTALALVALWHQTGRRSCAWAALLVTFALFQVRALLFMLFAPALLLTLASETAFVRRRARPLILATGIALASVIVLVAAVSPVRQAWLGFTAMRTFLEIVHKTQTPSAYDGAYQAIEERYGTASAQVLGFVALVPGALGALTIALPLAMTIAVRRTGWRPLDSFPVWCLLGWLALVLFAPRAAHGDFTTYQYHAFALVYAAAFVWTILLLHRATPGRFEHFWSGPLVAFLVAATGVAVAWKSDNPVKPRLSWGYELFGTRVDRGLLDAARYVHARAVPGDTFALLPVEPSAVLDDAAIRFAAMANVPAYLSRPAVYMVRPRLRPVVEQRVSQLRALESTTDPTVAFATLQRMGVTYLVVLGRDGPLFDSNHTRADFHTTGATVYRIGP